MFYWSVEPGLLYYQQWDRLKVQGQLQGWIPIDGTNLAGNILIYGAGVGYDVYRNRNLCVTPIMECVGWTVLNGFESVADGPEGVTFTSSGFPLPTSHFLQNASGDTIVNLKFGVRTYFGEHSDMYVGYGRAVTGDRWYRDIVRLEYRFRF